MPLRIMLSGTAAASALLFVWRTSYRYLARVIGVESVLLVGSNQAILQIARHIQEKSDCGLRVMGYMGLPLELEDPALGRHLGPVESVAEVTRQMKPDRIVIGMAERRARLPVTDLVDLRFEGYLIEEAWAVYESLCGRMPIAALLPSALIFSGGLGPRPRRVFWHNALNFGMGVAGVIVAAPLLIIVAAAVKLTSPGPVLYRQKRVGLNGSLFYVYKFRTMYDPLPEAAPELWDTEKDPRVTRLGRLLRKGRLNELPQIINVLKGEMAIVGPRPERPEYVAVFLERVPFYGQRHRVLPGITGWAQINYGHADSLEDTMMKLEYDLYYIKYLSVSLDVFIVWQTIKTVLLRRGAG
jgi:exopolysaccharide biosynthesis polyprenyl glycosylphosphotransferase